MGHGVVQLASQRHPLLVADLALLASPEVRAGAEHHRERDDQQQEQPRRRRRPSPPLRRTSQHDDDGHERRPPRSRVPSPTAPGSRAGPGRPSWRRGRGPRSSQPAGGPTAARRRPTRRGRPPGDGPAARAGRAPAPGRAPPRGGARPRPAARRPRRRQRREPARQQPVEATDRRGVIGPRLVPQGAPYVDHGSSLEIGAPRRTGRKNERRTVPSAGASPSPRADVRRRPARRSWTHRSPPRQQEPTMSTRRPTAATLDDPPVPVRAKLAAAWTSFMFLYVYVDVLGFYTPGTVEDILDGRVFEFDLSQTFSIAALTLVCIPIFMVVADVVLPARVDAHHEPRRGRGLRAGHGVQRGGRHVPLLLRPRCRAGAGRPRADRAMGLGLAEQPVEARDTGAGTVRTAGCGSPTMGLSRPGPRRRPRDERQPRQHPCCLDRSVDRVPRVRRRRPGPGAREHADVLDRLRPRPVGGLVGFVMGKAGLGGTPLEHDYRTTTARS